jgi:hypothetical protein
MLAARCLVGLSPTVNVYFDSGLNLYFFDELVGFMPVNCVYFGVTNLGLSLRPINQVTGLTHYPYFI